PHQSSWRRGTFGGSHRYRSTTHQGDFNRANEIDERPVPAWATGHLYGGETHPAESAENGEKGADGRAEASATAAPERDAAASAATRGSVQDDRPEAEGHRVQGDRRHHRRGAGGDAGDRGRGRPRCRDPGGCASGRAL